MIYVRWFVNRIKKAVHKRGRLFYGVAFLFCLIIGFGIWNGSWQAIHAIHHPSQEVDRLKERDSGRLANDGEVNNRDEVNTRGKESMRGGKINSGGNIKGNTSRYKKDTSTKKDGGINDEMNDSDQGGKLVFSIGSALRATPLRDVFGSGYGTVIGGQASEGNTSSLAKPGEKTGREKQGGHRLDHPTSLGGSPIGDYKSRGSQRTNQRQGASASSSNQIIQRPERPTVIGVIEGQVPIVLFSVNGQEVGCTIGEGLQGYTVVSASSQQVVLRGPNGLQTLYL